jgi:hypothetical protein
MMMVTVIDEYVDERRNFLGSSNADELSQTTKLVGYVRMLIQWLHGRRTCKGMHHSRRV